VFKWIAIGFVALVVLGALLGDPDEKQSTTNEGAAEQSSPEATQPEATPTPTPEVNVIFNGPYSVRTDTVTLRGDVEPPGATVKVAGKRAKVRNGRWTRTVAIKQRGDNTYRIVATQTGFDRASTTVDVTRKESGAEREARRAQEAAEREARRVQEAAERAEKAARRANRRALESAESYLSFSGFSKQGLYEQLSSSAGEGFTEAEAQYAVDHIDADWNKEAVESARSYLEFSSMSRQGLIEQLSSSAGEGFTYEQALYAVNKVY
jgi:hypothetical protein